jgi:hypothetical protein
MIVCLLQGGDSRSGIRLGRCRLPALRAYIFGFTERPGQHPDDLKRMLASPNSYELFYPSTTMPPAGPKRLAEAIRRALPETAMLQRYEARAIACRDRAIRELVSLSLKK